MLGEKVFKCPVIAHAALQYMPLHTVNIFDSKSGHLSNRIIERFFLIFSKHFAVFDDFSKWRVPKNSKKKSSNIAKNEENLASFT